MKLEEIINSHNKEKREKTILLKATIKVYKQLLFILEDHVDEDFFNIRDTYGFNKSFELLYKCKDTITSDWSRPRLKFSINEEYPSLVELTNLKGPSGMYNTGMGYSGFLYTNTVITTPNYTLTSPITSSGTSSLSSWIKDITKTLKINIKK